MTRTKQLFGEGFSDSGTTTCDYIISHYVKMLGELSEWLLVSVCNIVPIDGSETGCHSLIWNDIFNKILNADFCVGRNL